MYSTKREHKKLQLPLQVVFDDSKVMEFLKASSEVFETILDAEDKADGPTIEKVLADMEAADRAPIVQFLIAELFKKARAKSDA
jgi:hypothetical protein